MSSASPRLNATVEFLGLPGVGKSTLSRKAAAELASERLRVTEPIRRINDCTGPYRILSKARFAAEHHLRSPKSALATTHSLCAVDPGSSTDHLHVAFNLQYVAGVTARAHATSGVTLLDQGLYQGVWSIGLRSPTDWLQLLDRFDDVLSQAAPDLVVLVEADIETVADRLRARDDGDTRVVPNSPEFDRGVKGYEFLKSKLQSTDDTPASIVVENETPADLAAGADRIVKFVHSLPD